MKGDWKRRGRRGRNWREGDRMDRGGERKRS